MRRIAMVFAFAALAAAAQQHPRCRVLGRVVDARQVPLAGLEVRMDTVDEPWVSGPDAADPTTKVPDEGLATVTDADGRFAFEAPVPTSSWISLFIRSDEMHALAGTEFGAAGGRNKDPLHEGDNDTGTFVLVDTGAVSGRVLDAHGDPVARAQIEIDPNAVPETARGGYSVNARSAADGTYVLGHVPAGTYTVTAGGDRQLRQHREGVVIADRQTTPGIDFTLADAPSVAGRVTDAAGGPLEKVWVWGWPVSSGRGAGAWTDAEGRFRILLPQDEPYHLEAEKQGFVKYEQGFQSEGYPPGTENAAIVLERIGETDFLVIDADTSLPVEDFGLVIVDAPKENHFGSDPGDLPIYHFAGGATRWYADPQRHHYRIQAPGYAAQQGPILFDVPGIARQTIRLGRGGAIRGRVVDRGVPVAGVAVHAAFGRATTPSNTSGAFIGHRRSATTGADGTFLIGDLAAGAFELRAKREGSAPIVKTGVRVGAKETIDVGDLALVAGATIDGRVVDGSDAPIEGATVTLDRDVSFLEYRATTGKDGRFRFADLPAGKHAIVASPPNRSSDFTGFAFGGSETTTKVELKEGETQAVTIRLAAPAPPQKVRIDVTVKVDGKPLAGLAVTARFTEAWNWAQLGPTDAGGRASGDVERAGPFRVIVATPEGLILGRSEAQALKPEETGRSVALDLSAGSLVVVLPDGTRIPQGGSVSFAVGDPAATEPQLDLPFAGGIQVSRGNRGFPMEQKQIAWTDTRYELGLAPAGERIVRVTGDVLPYRKTIRIEPGKVNVVTMTLDDAD